jgi:hypothetical protein
LGKWIAAFFPSMRNRSRMILSRLLDFHRVCWRCNR